MAGANVWTHAGTRLVRILEPEYHTDMTSCCVDGFSNGMGGRVYGFTLSAYPSIKLSYHVFLSASYNNIW